MLIIYKNKRQYATIKWITYPKACKDWQEMINNWLLEEVHAYRKEVTKKEKKKVLRKLDLVPDWYAKMYNAHIVEKDWVKYIPYDKNTGSTVVVEWWLSLIGYYIKDEKIETCRICKTESNAVSYTNQFKMKGKIYKIHSFLCTWCKSKMKDRYRKLDK